MKTDCIHIPRGYPVPEEKIAAHCADRIQCCSICERPGAVDNVLVLPLAGGDSLALGVCCSCAACPKPQLEKIVHGLVEVFQTRAAHLQTNPN